MSFTDPHRVLSKAIIRKYIVAAGQTVKGGFQVKFAADDKEIQDAGADSQLAIGVARRPGKTYAAGDEVEVVHPFTAIVDMSVGTGGATRGKELHQVADGVADAPDWNAAGATVVPICGRAMQSGVAADHIGVGIYSSFRIAT